MIKISCQVTPDVNEMWPEVLPCRPMKGDLITSQCGLQFEVTLCGFNPKAKDTLFVELRPPVSDFPTIADFQRWYTNR